jgi:hypothetical protein
LKKKTDTRLIEQKQSNDCGMAALAMLYEIPYSTARALVLQAEKGKFDGTTIDHARNVGEAMADPVKVWYCTDESRPDVALRLLGRQAILVVPAADHKVSGDWHALYWTGRYVLDPSPTGKYGRKGIKALKTFKEAWVLQSESI